MFANTSTAEQHINPVSQWEDDGGPAPSTPTKEAPCVNVGVVERALSAYVGGSLLTWGLARRSLPGLFVAAAGGALIYRGATGHCRLYDSLGMSTADQDSKLSSAAQCCSAESQSESPAVHETSRAGQSSSEKSQQQTQWDLPTVGAPPISAPIASVVEKESDAHSMS